MSISEEKQLKLDAQWIHGLLEKTIKKNLWPMK